MALWDNGKQSAEEEVKWVKGNNTQKVSTKCRGGSEGSTKGRTGRNK